MSAGWRSTPLPIVGHLPPPEPQLLVRHAFRRSTSVEQLAALVSLVLLLAAIAWVGVAMHVAFDDAPDPRPAVSADLNRWV